MSFVNGDDNDLTDANHFNFDTKGRLYIKNNLPHTKKHYLTLREMDILRCLLYGYSAKKTGVKLGISYRTVESYIDGLKSKLDCAKKGDIISFCIKSGLFKILIELDYKL